MNLVRSIVSHEGGSMDYTESSHGDSMIKPTTLRQYFFCTTHPADLKIPCHFIFYPLRIHLEVIEGLLHGVDQNINLQTFPSSSTFPRPIKGYQRYLIDQSCFDEAHIFTSKEAPLLVNWFWISEQFKQKIFMLQD